ncbi:hypothetical protein [Prochlorothrix hollandica]|uniref:hypothetical protein n=1 Tax=Prochlorothrix hollandica TaxID=1223 RepID=UPI0033414435
MHELERLTSEATLGDLPLQDLCISHKTLGQAVAELFDQNQDLPGILVEDESGTIRLISRRRFHERMSSPYGLDLFLKRPISAFLDMCHYDDQMMEVLVLSHGESIDMAVRQGLQRNARNVYEPIIVIFEDETLPEFSVRSLLDFQVLLLAQAHLLGKANQRIREQQQETELYLKKYHQQQRKVQAYNQKLKVQQAVIQERNDTLEQQQADLLEKSEQIQELNARFLEVGAMLSSEHRKVFQATFAGVNRICRSADRILAAGSTLEEEVQVLHRISDSIAKVSRQVHHLSVKASIAVNQSQTIPSGFSTINEEISHLLSGTFEASQQLTQASDRFTQQIQDLSQAAQSGMNTAHSLISDMGEAQAAINELDILVKQPYRQVLGTAAADATPGPEPTPGLPSPRQVSRPLATEEFAIEPTLQAAVKTAHASCAVS